VMRSRCTARLPMAIAMAASIPVPRLEPRDIRSQACHQRHRTTILDRFCQVALRVSAGQIAASISFIMACQELRIGQQLINLAIAEDPAGRNRSAARRCAFEGPLVQRTHRLYITARTIGTQCKLPCQSLRIEESWAGALVATVSVLGVCMGIAS